MRPSRTSALLLGLLAFTAVEPAPAQSLDPRSFVDTPVGMNFVLGGYSYIWGSVLFDPTVLITNADVKVQGPFLGYARALDWWGLSGKASVGGSFACADGTGEVSGVEESRNICGLSDVSATASVNFIGAPALSFKEYVEYKQGLLVGASFSLTAPVGQYDPGKLVNIGTNRWALRPQIGVSQGLGRLTLEFLGAVTFYTSNDDFFGGHVRQQAPIYSGQLNVIYTFRSGIWGALGGTLYGGGRITNDGVESQEFEKNWRLGATLVFPVSRHNSLKLFGSTGLYTRTGGDFDLLAASWIYAWGGRKVPKHSGT